MNAPLAPADMGFHTLYRAPRRFEWDASVAIALSLAVHVLLAIALLRPAWPLRRAADERRDLVSVDLRASQPASAAQLALPEPPRRPRRADAARQGIESVLPRPDATLAVGADAGNAASARALKRGPQRSATTAAVEAVHAPTPTSAPTQLNQDLDNRMQDASSDYRRLLAEMLARVKRYPASAVAEHDEGTVWLSFRLDRSGRLLSWQIEQSSAYPLLDNEVARMVVAAAPYPPFPTAWPAAAASFAVPINFSLN